MIDLDWGNADETILVWTFSDGWTAKDLVNAIASSKRMIARRSHRRIVHVLMDIQHSQDMPDDMLTLGRYAIKEAIDSGHKGMIIIINPSPLWNHMVGVLKSLISNSIQIEFANDANEAYEILQNSETQTNDK